MRWIAGCAAVLVPLAIAPGLLFFDDVTPKVLLLLLLAAAATVAAVWNPAGLRALLQSPQGRIFASLTLAAIVATLVSTVRAGDRELAFWGSNWRKYGALERVAVLLLGASLACGAKASSAVAVWYLRGLSVSGLAAGLYATLQYFGADPLLPQSAYQAGEGPFRIVRPPATLGHSDYLGVFLLWAAFAGVAVALGERRKGWIALGWIAVCSTLTGMLLSGARAPLAGLLAGGVVLLFSFRPKLRQIMLGTAVAAGLLAVFVFSAPGERLRARIFWATHEPLGGARPLLWRDTLPLAATHLLAGVGPENFVSEFPRYQSLELARAFPDFYHESPHNLLLDSLAGEGLLSTLVLLALLVMALKSGLSGGAGVRSRVIAAAVAGAMVAHQFTVLTAPLSMCLFAALALLINRGDCELPRARPLPAALLLSGVTGCLLLAAAWQLGVPDYQLARARDALNDKRLADAAALYESAGSGPIHTGSADLFFSRRWAETARNVPDALSKMLCVRMANLASVRATHDPEQRPNALYNYAAFAAIRNDAPAAERSLRAAIEVSPNWFKPHWTLARLLAATGRVTEARREAARALELDGGKNPETAATLAQLP